MDIQTLLQYTVEQQASDLHLKVGSHPVLRINGELSVGENLADAGGVSLAYAALQRHLRSHPKDNRKLIDTLKAMRDLGLFDVEPVLVHGHAVSPREVFIAAVMPHLLAPEGRDLVGRQTFEPAAPQALQVRAQRVPAGPAPPDELLLGHGRSSGSGAPCRGRRPPPAAPSRRPCQGPPRSWSCLPNTGTR
jgi:hypothetical protein